MKGVKIAKPKSPQCPKCGAFFTIIYTPPNVDYLTGQLVYRCLYCMEMWEGSQETWVDSPYEENNG